jgi:hypothetical protein
MKYSTLYFLALLRLEISCAKDPSTIIHVHAGATCVTGEGPVYISNLSPTIGAPNTTITVSPTTETKIQIDEEISADSKLDSKLDSKSNLNSNLDNKTDQKSKLNGGNHTSNQDQTYNSERVSNSLLPSVKAIVYPILITGGVVYTVCLITIYRMKKLLDNEHAWCNWKAYSMLQDSKKMFIQELLETIESRGLNTQKPTDYISPMTQFLKELDNEQAILNHYLFAKKWSTRIYMHKILPGEDMRAIAQEKLDRLDFIKKSFFDWAKSQRSHKITRLATAH